HGLGEQLVVVELVVAAHGEHLLRLGGRAQAERAGDVERRLVLHLDELLLAARDVVGGLEEPGLDVDHLHLEGHLVVALGDRARDHLGDTELLGGLDLAEPALLAQEVDLLLRIHAQLAELAEDGVEAVAREVADPGRDVAAGVDLHDAEHDRARRLGDRGRGAAARRGRRERTMEREPAEAARGKGRHGRTGPARRSPAPRCRRGLGGAAGLPRAGAHLVEMDRVVDVLELAAADVAEGQLQAVLDRPVHVGRHGDTPGGASAWMRAAMLMLSPKSPASVRTTSPRWMPMRMRSAFGRPCESAASRVWIATAASTASTALWKSATKQSPTNTSSVPLRCGTTSRKTSRTRPRPAIASASLSPMSRLYPVMSASRTALSRRARLSSSGGGTGVPGAAQSTPGARRQGDARSWLGCSRAW